MQHTAYIALGSNVEPRAQTLMRAMELLDERPGVSVRQVSQLIETAPEGPVSQGPFLNGAARLVTTLAPEGLLEALHDVEGQLGRNRAVEIRWGPRTCDLDLLLYEDVQRPGPGLILPHPRMHERLFVLRPLAQIAADAVHPGLRRTVAQLLADLEGRP